MTQLLLENILNLYLSTILWGLWIGFLWGFAIYLVDINK